MKTIYLRTIYAVHILLPLSIAAWHLEQLSADTLEALRALFS